MYVISKHRKLYIEITCLLFEELFVHTVLSKLADYKKFKAKLGQSPILTAHAYKMAWDIPALELLVGVMLVFSKSRLVALYASFFLNEIKIPENKNYLLRDKCRGSRKPGR